MELTDIKTALRVTTTAYDDELTNMMNSALTDLGIAGVEVPEESDPIITQAVITYCKIHFGKPDPKEWAYLKTSYDEQKTQLSMATGYTDWGDSE